MPITLPPTSTCPYNPFETDSDVVSTISGASFAGSPVDSRLLLDTDSFMPFVWGQPAQFRFTPITTPEDLRAHFDVSELPSEQMEQALAARIDAVTHSAGFQVSVLARRCDLCDFEAVLTDKIKQCEVSPSKPISLVSRLFSKRKRFDNLSKLHAAQQIISQAKAHKNQIDQTLEDILSKSHKDLEAITRLVNQGARVQPATFLDEASFSGNGPLITLLAKSISDINCRDEKTGISALRSASGNGQLEVVRALILAHADLDQSDRHGYTPVSAAAYYGHVEVIEALTGACAMLDKAAECGWRPLHFAAEKGHARAITALIAANASLNLATDGGETPLDVAKRLGKVEAIKVLEAAGAKKRT